jgi:hypothetical protein
MRILFFMLCLLISIAAKAQDAAPDEWRACQTDDECSVTTGYCDFDWAVNKEYFDQVKKIVLGEQSCLKTGVHNPNTAAQCINGRCTVVSSGLQK